MAAAGVAAVLLAGCAGGQSGPSAPTSAPAVVPTPTASAGPSPTAPAAEVGAASERPRQAQRVQPLHKVGVALDQVATLASPIAMAVRPGDQGLYVAERDGRIRVLRNGEVLDQPVLDISGQISTGGERGLLGFTFAADGAELYVSYTNVEGDSRLDAYRMRGDRAVPDSRRELLAVDQPYANHNGGNVVRGPDDMLYVGLGDGGSGGDPDRTAQDPGSLLGKMLRLDPRDGSAPADNPFVDQPEYQPEIFATGLRNPWRFSFDRSNGDLWVADVGQNEIEEVNRTPFARAAGRNYAWSILQGSQPYNGEQAPARAVRPVVEYPTADGCAVTGGYVYRGSAVPGLRGAYLFSDYCAGFVRAVRVQGGQITDSAELDIRGEGIASFGEDADGELYLLSLNGSVSKIVAD